MDKRFTILVPVVLCSLAGVALGRIITTNMSEAGRGTVARVEPRTLDFGTVPEGKRVTGTVRVVNLSDKPLYVSHVATSCGCTSTGKLSLVPAHGSAPLAVTFDSSGRPGAIEKEVSIFITETPDEPITLSLGGTVKTEWRVTPTGTLELGTIPGGETKTATVSIHRVSGGAVAFAKPPVSDGVRATITPDAGFKVATVSVMAVASRLPGAKQETITLTPTDVSLPPVRIPGVLHREWSIHHVARSTQLRTRQQE